MVTKSQSRLSKNFHSRFIILLIFSDNFSIYTLFLYGLTKHTHIQSQQLISPNLFFQHTVNIRKNDIQQINPPKFFQATWRFWTWQACWKTSAHFISAWESSLNLLFQLFKGYHTSLLRLTLGSSVLPSTHISGFRSIGEKWLNCLRGRMATKLLLIFSPS